MIGLLLMLSTLFTPIDASASQTRFSESTVTGTEAYEAVSGGKRRKTVIGSHKSEDRLLLPNARKRLAGNARDLTRNFSIVAWAVRRHLDYITQFQFHARTADKGFNRELERLVDVYGRKSKFDAVGKHSRAMMLRLLEAHAILDGDNGWVKRSDGTVQGLEGDRVRNPPLPDLTAWTHGIQTEYGGKALAYAVHKRTLSGFEFERIVPARNMLWHGYFARYDQIRGVSPISSGLNLARDVHENFDLALAKLKVTQIFAMAILRAAGAEENPGQLTGGEDADGNEDKADYTTDFGAGPVMLDMDHGDDAKVLESSTPSDQFQSYTLQIVMAFLKSLDIPFSFYDESHTNFFGSRGSWLHYERSCDFKREQLEDLLDAWTYWRLTLAILDGELTLPSGKTLSDLDWLWVARGMPWWDPAKEIRGDLMAIQAGLTNPQEVCRRRDSGEYYDNIDKISEAIEYAQNKNVPVSFAPGPDPVEVVANDGK